ncbi:hypothetical protein V6N11_048600 [Hibiscus sabdariffa]|uniref:C2H2-type domain-containing protein n=1 Tax=Hibiscus sabdariffa TaxID=183260 RepID=A0ABR2PW87_9ROSI
MNLDSCKEATEKHGNSKTCFYCKKEFDNYQALGFHLRIHQEDQSLSSFNFPGRSGNSIDINPPIPLPNSQQNSAGANNLVSTAQEPPPVDFYTIFHSDDANQASSSRSTVGNHGVPQTQIWMSPYDIALLYNSLDPGAFDPADTNSPPYFVNEDLIYEDDLPPTSPDALNNTQDYDLGPEDLPLLDNFVELTSDAATGDGVEEEGKQCLCGPSIFAIVTGKFLFLFGLVSALFVTVLEYRVMVIRARADVLDFVCFKTMEHIRLRCSSVYENFPGLEFKG